MTRYRPPEGPGLVVLGPCACHDCGEPLFFAERNTRYNGVTGKLRAWRNQLGLLHLCARSTTVAGKRSRAAYFRAYRARRSAA